MNKKKKLVPEIRFPEFVDSGEWEEKALKGLAEKVLVKNKGGLINKVFTNSAIDGIVDQRDYFDKDIADKNNLENYYLVEPEDYVYNPRISNIAPVGPISKNKTKLTGAMSPLYTVFRFKNKNNGFYEYYFKSVRWFDSIRKASNTGARFDRMSMTDSVFMDIPVLYPQPEEQQKIAACLSSIDDLIKAHIQKWELLKSHKKGLMQKLFPQEGEKVPKYRFKEFKNDATWNYKELNELGDLINGLTYSPDDVRKKGLLVLRSSNIQNGLIDFNDCVYVRTDVKGANLSKPNDILICVRNGSKNLIGKNAIIPEDIQLATHGAFMTVFRAKNPEFVFQLFQTDFYTKQVKADLGATINSINGKNFLKYEFPIPENPEEQQKISKCLSLLDDLIEAQAEKIEQLKLHKKGLMQGLFPKIID
jgi:type I restriction enzyme S subunit